MPRKLKLSFLILTITCGMWVFKRNINISKKEDVIAYMIQHTIKQEDLIEKMIENDYIGNYELENMVAVLSCQANIPESKVIMAILEKPILWNKRKVQLIIMPIIGAHMNLQVLDLFKELSLLVQNALYIKKIIAPLLQMGGK